MERHTVKSINYQLYMNAEFVKQCLLKMFKQHKLWGVLKTIGYKLFKRETISFKELGIARNFCRSRTNEIVECFTKNKRVDEK